MNGSSLMLKMCFKMLALTGRSHSLMRTMNREAWTVIVTDEENLDRTRHPEFIESLYLKWFIGLQVGCGRNFALKSWDIM